MLAKSYQISLTLARVSKIFGGNFLRKLRKLMSGVFSLFSFSFQPFTGTLFCCHRFLFTQNTTIWIAGEASYELICGEKAKQKGNPK
jgi:hypothetical protein